ncbi:mechanosensitive ion channel family protein [Haemophilus paraphrohaemolyticus]|uniref:Small-conductance mechanosensitive channel n=1 Tax=Haemophilus paraphrohaemolyticus HK411 TaxID=1095743 RepID=I2NH63_9PAST|nr:mechanosensitive ion channel domain-containing protein [Haemophilus paraphrohaemolyticus]EIG25174.1 transporter, small conductance mechanosensitive ion channel MscS family protein [Haemophilus paraphrohaemolyticus HK411]OOR94198.1 mechanosensitive ion channel protein MscS [Haemophilus paraphrohaemolyticus]STP00722.1 Small-conductance mechanosensitive channel [Haemophilus paraphrohaemolyticus]
MSETAQTATQNIDVVATTEKVLKKVDSMSFDAILNDYMIPYGTKIILAIAIFVIGKWLAKAISKLLSKAVLASTKDEMLQSFIRSISYFLLLLIVVIASLSQLGINTSSLVALIGAAGLAIGLSLQNSLQNFAAGVMLLIFKPFQKGDQIETGGTVGTIQQMGILVLELRTSDNKTVLIPNSNVFSGKITNYSANDTRRLNFVFDIAYDTDLRKAKEIILQILTNEGKVLSTPAPDVSVSELAANSVKLGAQAWVNTSDASSAYSSVLEQVKLAFDEAGIVIPFNQLDVNLMGTDKL